MQIYYDIAKQINLQGADGNILHGIQKLIDNKQFKEIKLFLPELFKHPQSKKLLLSMQHIGILLNRSDKSVNWLKNSNIPYDNYPEMLAVIADYYFIHNDEPNAFKSLRSIIIKLKTETEIFSFINGNALKLAKPLAESLIKIALEIFPDNTNLLRLFGFFLKNNARYEEALNIFYKYTVLDDTDSKIWMAISECLTKQGLYTDAFTAAIKMYSINSIAVTTTIVYLESLIKSLDQNPEGDRFQDASRLLETIKQVTSTVPNNLTVNDMYITLKYAMAYDLAKKIPIKNIESYLINNTSLLPIMYRMDDVKTREDKIALLEMHKKWGSLTSSQTSPLLRNTTSHKKASSKINVGIVSFGFRKSIIAKFIKPLIEGLDKSNFNLHMYAIGLLSEDEFSNLSLQNSYKFKRYPGNLCMGNVVAESIIEDNIDVTLDIGVGLRHTIYKPSKIAISWLDYPHSSGLPLDYIMVDPYINPDPALILEKPLILPQSWVCIDKDMFGKPTIEETLPSDRAGHITFGTMNTSFKITEEALKSWANIMHMVPHSKFLYSRPTTSMNALRRNFCLKMMEYGIEPDRIIFQALKGDEYINLYNHIDVALDTFPRTGGTTTCEALWMGVPVVTLVGDAFFERLSYSNLMNIGAADLCAFSIPEYEKIAVNISQNTEKRLAFRRGIRERIMQNPLGNRAQFIKGFSDAIVRGLKGVDKY